MDHEVSEYFGMFLQTNKQTNKTKNKKNLDKAVLCQHGKGRESTELK